MTAEIVLMNREAVALAADSAVVLGFASSHKIFHSAKKLFALSKYQPVGIMVYGTVLFMGVPWETIIKTYRDKLDKTEFDDLEGYAKNFIEYLDNNENLFPISAQENYGRSKIFIYFLAMRDEIEDAVKNYIEKHGGIGTHEINTIIMKLINSHYSLWRKTKKLELFSKGYDSELKDNFDQIIDESMLAVFQKLPLTDHQKKQLKTIALSLFLKTNEEYLKLLAKKGLSGIVIAGFGKRDIFPSLRSFFIENVAINRLKYTIDLRKSITYEVGVEIIPFAEREMVDAFLHGAISPSDNCNMSKFYQNISERLEDAICAFASNKCDIETRNELKKQILKSIEESFDDNSIDAKNSLNQIMNVISRIPKQELAELAESLINITTLKQRFTALDETVGGPIDVALISKGDGFIWIKRKHYFNSKLNPHFIKKCYGDEHGQARKT